VIFLSRTFPIVFAALAQREGRKTTLPTLVSVTGLTADQIKLAIRHARSANETHRTQIKVEEPGRAWRFVATPRGRVVTPEEAVKAVDMGSRHIWRTVLKVLMDHPGEILYKAKIAELVVAENPDEYADFTEAQVVNALNTILRRQDLERSIEVVWTMNAWRYKAPAGEATPDADTTSATKTKVSTPIRGSVLRYFTMHPRKTLFADDIARDLGFTRKQVQSALWSLMHETSTVSSNFKTINPSNAWKFTPDADEAAPVPAPTPTPVTSSNGHVPSASVVQTQAGPVVVPPSAPMASPVLPAPVATLAAATPAVGGRLFEEIGQASNGDLLVQESESKDVYRATRL